MAPPALRAQSDLKQSTLSGPVRTIALVACLAVMPITSIAQTSEAPIQHYIMIDMKPGVDVLALDRWYLTHHAPETLARTGGTQTTYVSYRTYEFPDAEAAELKISRGRMTEIEFPSLAVFRAGFTPEARARVPLTLPDPSIRGGWETETVTMNSQPYRTYKNGPTPARAVPYFRWVMFVAYPQGVTTRSGDAWLEGVLGPAIADQATARRVLLYRGVMEQRYTRVLEVWFDTQSDWSAAIADLRRTLVAPPWNGSFPYVENRSTFIGDRPDLDFRTDARVIP